MFFKEISKHGKFTKAPHENKKFQTMIKQKTSEEKEKEFLNAIEDVLEDDAEERCEFLILLNKVKSLKTESDRVKELARIESLLLV